MVDHDTRRVVWAGKGRSAETLGAFFKQLGPGGCARIELVTADLASSWRKALAAWVPHARVVFDRFHVERLASDTVDEVRRSEQRRLDPADAKALKGTRYQSVAEVVLHPAGAVLGPRTCRTAVEIAEIRPIRAVSAHRRPVLARCGVLPRAVMRC